MQTTKFAIITIRKIVFAIIEKKVFRVSLGNHLLMCALDLLSISFEPRLENPKIIVNS